MVLVWFSVFEIEEEELVVADELVLCVAVVCVVVDDEEELEDVALDWVESIEVEVAVFDVDRDLEEAVERVVLLSTAVLVEPVTLFVTERPFIFAAVIPTAIRRTITASANNITEADLFILEAQKYSHFSFTDRSYEQIVVI